MPNGEFRDREYEVKAIAYNQEKYKNKHDASGLFLRFGLLSIRDLSLKINLSNIRLFSISMP